MVGNIREQKDLTALLIAMVEIAYEVRAQGFEAEYQQLDQIIQRISYKNFGSLKKRA